MKTYMEAEVQTESESLISYDTEVSDEDEADDVGSTCGDDDHEKDRLLENTLLQLKIAKNLREAQQYSKTVNFESESDWNSDDDF